MNLGVLYAGRRTPYQPPIGGGRLVPDDLEAEFSL